MSMSTHVVGFKAPDETWVKYKAIWDACEAAGVDIPKSVIGYFNGEPPDEAGVSVDLDDIAKEWNEDSSAGYEILIADLPKDLTSIRFYNNW